MKTFERTTSANNRDGIKAVLRNISMHCKQQTMPRKYWFFFTIQLLVLKCRTVRGTNLFTSFVKISEILEFLTDEYEDAYSKHP